MRDLLGVARVAGTVLRLGGRYRWALWLSLVVGVVWLVAGCGVAHAGTGVAGQSSSVVVANDAADYAGDWLSWWWRVLVVGVVACGAVVGWACARNWVVQRRNSVRGGAERVAMGGDPASPRSTRVLRRSKRRYGMGRVRQLTRIRWVTERCDRCDRPFTQCCDKDAWPRSLCGLCLRAVNRGADY